MKIWEIKTNSLYPLAVYNRRLHDLKFHGSDRRLPSDKIAVSFVFRSDNPHGIEKSDILPTDINLYLCSPEMLDFLNEFAQGKFEVCDTEIGNDYDFFELYPNAVERLDGRFKRNEEFDKSGYRLVWFTNETNYLDYGRSIYTKKIFMGKEIIHSFQEIFFQEDLMDEIDIFRIEAESSILTRIFVTDTFKKNFEDRGLVGVDFRDRLTGPIKIYQD